MSLATNKLHHDPFKSFGNGMNFLNKAENCCEETNGSSIDLVFNPLAPVFLPL